MGVGQSSDQSPALLFLRAAVKQRRSLLGFHYYIVYILHISLHVQMFKINAVIIYCKNKTTLKFVIVEKIAGNVLNYTKNKIIKE